MVGSMKVLHRYKYKYKYKYILTSPQRKEGLMGTFCWEEPNKTAQFTGSSCL